MAISNFRNGFVDGVSINGVLVRTIHNGQVFYVGNSTTLAYGQTVGGSDGNPGTLMAPFGTIQAAINATTSGRGDIIMVLPGHAETLSTASGAGFTNANKHNIAIIGMGYGNNRPTFNITTSTSAGPRLSGNNLFMANLVFTGGVTGILGWGLVTGTDCTFSNIEYRDVTGVCAYALALFTARNKLLRYKHYGATSAGATCMIYLDAANNTEIQVDRAEGTWAGGGVKTFTTASTNLHIHDWLNYRSRGTGGDVVINDAVTGSTGQVGPNMNLRLSANAANITEAVTGATFVVMDPIYTVNADNEKAMLINWTASTDA